MVEVLKAKDGSIEEIIAEMTVQEKHGGGSKLVVIPDEFFTLGGLPLKKGDLVRMAMKLKGEPKIVMDGKPVGVSTS